MHQQADKILARAAALLREAEQGCPRGPLLASENIHSKEQENLDRTAEQVTYLIAFHVFEVVVRGVLGRPAALLPIQPERGATKSGLQVESPAAADVHDAGHDAFF